MTENNSFEEGGKSCLTLAGLGKLAPNMLLIGFKSNWAKDLDSAAQYFNILEVIQVARCSHSDLFKSIDAVMIAFIPYILFPGCL